MWGDYHAREVALYVQRVARDEPYYTFFGGGRRWRGGAAGAKRRDGAAPRERATDGT